MDRTNYDTLKDSFLAYLKLQKQALFNGLIPGVCSLLEMLPPGPYNDSVFVRR
jgi:hypothetical protein